MSGAICAICYEDVHICSDLLQSISGCGHVFHELCLQQWIEYCPKGRTPACPLCKSSCAAKDAHRLYFQSASESQQQKVPPCATSKSNSPDCKSSEVDRVHISRLEAKVRMLANACQISQEQILDLTAKEEKCKGENQALEAELKNLKKERAILNQELHRIREELKASAAQRQGLLRRNVAMEMDLAAHKLVSDVNLGEEEVLNLALLSRGNKDDTIQTLTKSLILRNRAYKDLMIRCNQLGTGEGRAKVKAEKVIEKVKRLKEKLIAVSKAQEERVNARLRALANSEAFHKFPETATSPPTPCSTATNESRAKDWDTPPSSESGPQGTNVGSCSKRADEVIAVDKYFTSTCQRDRDRTSAVGSRRHSCESLGSDFGRQLSEANREGSSHRDSTALSHISAVDEIRSDSVEDSAGSFQELTVTDLGEHEQSLNDHFRNRTGSSPLESDNIRNRTLISDTHYDERNVCELDTLPIPIRREAGPGQKRHFTQEFSIMSGRRYCPPIVASNENSRYIISGADGRGGRITILKPPPVSMAGSSGRPAAIKAKRLKPTPQATGSTALKIEHFFGPVPGSN